MFNTPNKRMYALTCGASVLWLGSTLHNAAADGTLTHWSTIIFALCIAVVVAWTGYNAFKPEKPSAAESDIESGADSGSSSGSGTDTDTGSDSDRAENETKSDAKIDAKSGTK